jgi:hypothetical protein
MRIKAIGNNFKELGRLGSAGLDAIWHIKNLVLPGQRGRVAPGKLAYWSGVAGTAADVSAGLGSLAQTA